MTGDLQRVDVEGSSAAGDLAFLPRGEQLVDSDLDQGRIFDGGYLEIRLTVTVSGLKSGTFEVDVAMVVLAHGGPVANVAFGVDVLASPDRLTIVQGFHTPTPYFIQII